MYLYYLFCKTKEVSNYIVKSLDDCDVTIIEDSTKLFEINQKDSLLILHIDSYDGDAIELVKLLLKDSKNLKILVLINNVNFLQGTALFQAGVRGYGNAYMHGALLHQAIDVIKSENIWIYPELAQHLIKNLTKSKNKTGLDLLSKAEKECAVLAASGSSNKEISQLLDRQEITVKKHLSSAYKKLGLKNRIELALYVN